MGISLVDGHQRLRIGFAKAEPVLVENFARKLLTRKLSLLTCPTLELRGRRTGSPARRPDQRSYLPVLRS